jgi:hypothetical protein
MTHLRRRRLSPNLVNSPKCAAAIRAATPLHRDLLIQSSLDPHVRSIEFADEVIHRDCSASPRSIVLYRDDGRFMMNVVGVDARRDPDDREHLLTELHSLGISLLEVRPEEILREPLCGNARRVWEYRHENPSMRQRERILQILSELGPRTVHELEVTSASYDVLPTVCALACTDVVEIDIDGRPLGPRTVVRARR